MTSKWYCVASILHHFVVGILHHFVIGYLHHCHRLINSESNLSAPFCISFLHLSAPFCHTRHFAPFCHRHFTPFCHRYFAPFCRNEVFCTILSVVIQHHFVKGSEIQNPTFLHHFILGSESNLSAQVLSKSSESNPFVHFLSKAQNQTFLHSFVKGSESDPFCTVLSKTHRIQPFLHSFVKGS